MQGVLILLGIGTLAFSQLENTESNLPTDSSEAAALIAKHFNENQIRLERVLKQSDLFLDSQLASLKNIAQNDVSELQTQWEDKMKPIRDSLTSTKDNLQQAKNIFDDIKDSFAGELDEAMPTFKTLFKNLKQSETEIAANESLYKIAEDELSLKLEALKASSMGVANDSKASLTFANSNRIASVINAGEAVDLPPMENFSPETQKLHGDLAKAREDVQNLENNLMESEALVSDLKKDNEFLSESINSGDQGTQVVRSAFLRLRGDLQRSRNELSDTKRKMVDEREKSTALIKNITNELERSRDELSKTKNLAEKAQDDRAKLNEIEKELVGMQDSLEIILEDPNTSGQVSSIKSLSKSVDKVLADVKLFSKDPSARSLEKVTAKGQPSEVDKSDGNNELVNRLLVDLNTAKKEISEAKAVNRQERQALNERIAFLEDKLQVTKNDLSTADNQLQGLRKEMAKRELEFASTIRELEEEAQIAQKALEDASRGKLPAVPFIEEMERNLADSEKRVQDLSEKFDVEKEKAAEVIAGLQVELENAVIRQKRAMDQLGRRETELEGTEQEMKLLREDKKNLEEELEVVKVLSAQLQDLNNVLEDTKKAQNLNAISTDEVVKSLRDELNKAKVELTFEKEDKERLLKESGMRVQSLEGQMQQLKDKLLQQQESLSKQSLDSKDLILDLKSELDQAREEIARMKSAGFTESVETQQAVAQLQEALGTIRVLKESLEESEKANLELDNLRTEIADSMNQQISQMKIHEDDRKQLTDKIADLEAEILIFRNKDEAGTLETKKLVAELNKKLLDSNEELSRLKTNFENSESDGVSNIIMLQEELAEEETKNQQLRTRIEDLEQQLLSMQDLAESSKENADSENRMSRDLEERLLKAIEELTVLKNKPEESAGSNPNEELTQSIIAELESSLVAAESTISKLKNELNSLSEKQSMVVKNPEVSTQSNEVIQDLEDSLAESENIISKLEGELYSMNEKQATDLETLEASNQTNEVIQDLEKSLAESEETISKLEKELEASQNLKKQQNSRDLELSDSIILDLETSLASAENTIIALQDELMEAKALAEKGKDNPTSDFIPEEEFKKLQAELIEAKGKVELLQIKNDDEEKSRLQLQKRLDDALAQNEFAGAVTADQNLTEENPTLENYKIQLRQKDQRLAELEIQLSDSIAELAEKEAELELVSAMNSLEKVDGNDSKEIDELKRELAALKRDLEQAKSDAQPSINPSVNDLQLKLEEAIAESFELQAQLDVTQKRLLELENNQDPSDDLIAQYTSIIEKAQTNEKKAIEEIDSLTNALKNSEELRKELETLLDEIQQQGLEKQDIANDPRVLELQQELLLLQEGLRAARKFKDPKVAELENELASSRQETEALKDDFKSAMKDFVRLRNEVELIEQDNERLKDQNLANAKTDADRQIIDLKNQVAGLNDQNSLLKLDIEGRDRRIVDLKNQMMASQNSPIITNVGPQDSGQMRSQVIALEGSLQAARDAQNRARMEADRLGMELQQSRQREASLETSLRNALANGRSIPVPNQNSLSAPLSPGLSNAQIIELENLKQQNKRLQDQLASAATNSDRDLLEQRIRDLNQRNLTAQVQLDQERKRSKDLQRELEDAKNIKRGIIEKGESASLKADLLNEELSNARNRIDSLEKALIAAREAIRVLRSGGNNNSMINVSLNTPTPKPSVSGTLTRRSPVSLSSPRTSSSYTSRFQPTSYSQRNLDPSSSPQVTQVPMGNASMDLKVEVQFLNNRNRPSSFTEFFLVEKDLNTIMEDARIRIPVNQGVNSYGELWARSVQRGYRFPGVAANIRNALATTSLLRLKTNSVGEAKLRNIKPGGYYLIGASTLGQVGVVWSKPISVRSGSNNISLGLGDAVWAE